MCKYVGVHNGTRDLGGKMLHILHISYKIIRRTQKVKIFKLTLKNFPFSFSCSKITIEAIEPDAPSTIKLL